MDNDDIYTKDGTIDYCNNPANKLTTGTWKACPYILGVFLPKFILLQMNVLMVGRNVLYSICFYRKRMLRKTGILWDQLQLVALFQKSTERA